MAHRRLRASRATAPPAADDFKLIKGIGPAITSRLHTAGILTFAQLAALSPDEFAALVTSLSTKRVVKENWIGQARKLASKRVPTKPCKKVTALKGRQHYATFTVELLLDEHNDVRRTRVAHVQSGEKGKWVGWQDARLIDFFVQRSALRLPPVAGIAERASPPSATSGLAGALRLRELEIVSADSDVPCNALHYGQPFEAHLILDLTEVIAPSEVQLAYTAAIYAKKLGGDWRQIVGEARGVLTPADRVTILVEGTAMPRGIYRLQAVVTLTEPSVMPSLRTGLLAGLKGGMFHVY